MRAPVLRCSCSVPELIRGMKSMAASLLNARDSDRYVRRDFEVVFDEDGRDLAYMCDGTLVLQSLERQGLSSNYGRRRKGNWLSFL